MKKQHRLSANQRGYATMLGAIAARLPGAHKLRALGVPDQTLVRMACDAGVPSVTKTEHWRSAPFGMSKRTVAGERRKAKKLRAIKRARKQGRT